MVTVSPSTESVVSRPRSSGAAPGAHANSTSASANPRPPQHSITPPLHYSVPRCLRGPLPAPNDRSQQPDALRAVADAGFLVAGLALDDQRALEADLLQRLHEARD